MCKKHNWHWLYLPTPETDKVGWFVQNLTPGGGLSAKDDVVCVSCGTLGWRRKSRYGNISAYPKDCQFKKAIEAEEIRSRLKLKFPDAALFQNQKSEK